MFIQLNNTTSYEASRIDFRYGTVYIYLKDSDTVIEVSTQDIDIITDYSLDA